MQLPTARRGETTPRPASSRCQVRPGGGSATGVEAGSGSERIGTERCAATMLCGGASKAQPATSETQQIADEVKPQLEEKEGKTFDVFTAVEFKTQLVAGTNYFIKVHVGNDEFMHLRVFRSLPHEDKPLSLHGYQSSKTKHDELTYF